MKNRKPIHPWISIWTRPRDTIQSILTTEPRRFTLLLSILYGIVLGLTWFCYLIVTRKQDEMARHPVFLIFLLLFCTLLSLIHLYFGSWLYRLTGRWLKGEGTYTEVKCAIGWSYYPMTVALLFNLFQILTLKFIGISIIFALIYFVLNIWAIVITLHMVGQAHRFSAWRALGCMLLAIILILIIFVLVTLIIQLLGPLFR